MSTITRIVFPCTNDTMGDTSPADCDAYRIWFQSQLETQYPGADVSVTASPGRIDVETSDDSDEADLLDELHEFGNRCWDRCPWDFS